MKFPKLFVSALIGCVLVGTSGAAMARNDCPDGELVGGTYEEIVINQQGVSCTILGVYVDSDIKIRNVNGITIKGSVADNLVVADSGTVNIVENQIASGLVSRNNVLSNVVRNIVYPTGALKVVRSCVEDDRIFEVEVVQNLVFGGKLTVNCQDRAVVVDNIVKNGSIQCNDNLELVSRGNYAPSLTCNP